MAERATRVRRERSPAGEWELAQGPPDRALAGLIRGYTGFAETCAVPLRRREVPEAEVTMIINFGVPLEVGAVGGEATAHAGSFVARVSPRPATTAFTGTSRGIEVNLSPLGAHMLLGLPMHELPEPAVDLGELLGSRARALTDRLEAAPSWEERFDLLDRAIHRRLAAARAPRPSVEWAWQRLVASGGRAEIGALCRRLGCSPRHLITGFREQVGVTPKIAARILRFQAAARAVHAHPTRPLARIAADAGYYDQAHMNRDFRELALTAPARFRAASIPGFLGVAEDWVTEVNSVQEPSARPA